jgi:hypothetical protein
MFSTLFGLTAAGNTFVVASRPDIASPANPVATARAARSADAEMTAHDFYVTCMGFPDHACPRGVDIELALELFSARTALVGLGYPEPRLPVRSQQIGTAEHVLVGDGYQVFLVPENDEDCWSEGLDDGAGGIYYPILGQLVVCLPFDHTSLGDYDSVADHEYFHAEQFAFPNVYANGDQTALIEGTAAMAGFSIHEPELHRNPQFKLHPSTSTSCRPTIPICHISRRTSGSSSDARPASASNTCCPYSRREHGDSRSARRCPVATCTPPTSTWRRATCSRSTRRTTGSSARTARRRRICFYPRRSRS